MAVTASAYFLLLPPPGGRPSSGLFRSESKRSPGMPGLKTAGGAASLVAACKSRAGCKEGFATRS
jgi:hypothetical protein